MLGAAEAAAGSKRNASELQVGLGVGGERGLVGSVGCRGDGVMSAWEGHEQQSSRSSGQQRQQQGRSGRLPSCRWVQANGPV
jgi:hypothetical protein